MNAETILTLAGISCYVVASVMAITGLMHPSRLRDRWVLILIVVGALSLFSVLATHAVGADQFRAFTRFEAFTSYAIVVTAAYLILRARRKLTGSLAAILVPYVTVVLVIGAPAVRSEVSLSPQIESIWLGLHVIFAFSGYAFFSLAGVLAAAYLVQDHYLKRKRFSVWLERLPALETLDRLMGVQVAVAFLLLTIAIVMGIMLVSLIGGGQEWITDPKIIATIAAWGVYAIVVQMRASADRHGRRAAVVVLVGFFCLLFAFIGVHIVTDSVHGYLLVRGGGG